MDEKLNVNVIKEYMEINQLSKTKFCKQCRIGTATFDKLMQNEIPNLLSVFKMAKNMNIHAYQLFESSI